MTLSNRTGIVTGGSSGIGRSTALQLAAAGCRLVLTGRNAEALASLESEINDRAGALYASSVAGDITDRQTTEDCIGKCFSLWNSAPSLFVASAGRGLPGTLSTSDESGWKQLVETNMIGMMSQLKAISESMKASRIQHPDMTALPYDIIVIGSSIGRNVSPFNSVYGATKFATHGLTEALRRELGPQGIRVSLIEPGLVATNFQANAGYDMQWFAGYAEEVGPVLTPDDVARTIAFLAGLPGNVHLDNVSIRPTRQAYP